MFKFCAVRWAKFKEVAGVQEHDLVLLLQDRSLPLFGIEVADSLIDNSLSMAKKEDIKC
jgi:hypothetical protein